MEADPRLTKSGIEHAKAAHALVYGGQVPGTHHASKMHELIAAAAGFEAMKAYEERQAQRAGQPVNHATMKELLAGLSASAIDYLIETKGLDYIDRAKAKMEAQKIAEHIATEKHGMRTN